MKKIGGASCLDYRRDGEKNRGHGKTNNVWQAETMGRNIKVDPLLHKRVSTSGEKMGGPPTKGLAQQFHRHTSMDGNMWAMAVAELQILGLEGSERLEADLKELGATIAMSDKPITVKKCVQI